MRRDYLDALLGEFGVERVRVVGSISDQPLRLLFEEARRERRFYEGNLVR